LTDPELWICPTTRSLLYLADIARHLALTHKFHKATERNPVHAPARAMLVLALENRLSKADREGFHSRTKPASDQIMAEFVHDHHDPHHEDQANEKQRSLAENLPQKSILPFRAGSSLEHFAPFLD
jgi:hypothetical protein